jgi:hypothetical protein
MHPLKRGGGLFADREEDDIVFQILASTVVMNSGAWMKNGKETYCMNCPMGQHNNNNGGGGGGGGSADGMSYASGEDMNPLEMSSDELQEPLECGKPANFTYYDQLMGIANRHNHPNIPEPQVAMSFLRKGSKKDTVDLNILERKLRKHKKEVGRMTTLEYHAVSDSKRLKDLLFLIDRNRVLCRCITR